MRLDPETRRRCILPLLAVALLAGYMFVFLPLAHKAERLDAPLNQSWRKLAALLGQTNALALDFVSLTNQFRETRSAITAFEEARNQARQRVELDRRQVAGDQGGALAAAARPRECCAGQGRPSGDVGFVG